MEERKKLSNKTIIGYGIGAVADASAYNFVIMYMLFYLTTVAGMKSVSAGLAIGIATILQAVLGLIIGPLSDNTRSKYGRRRPYILAGGILLFVSMFLLFRVNDFNDTGKFVYYLIMMSLFWISYMTFVTPYNALGSEMTLDYNERTKLRTPATILNGVGEIIGMSLPLAVIAMFTSHGASNAAGWGYFTLMLGAFCLITILIMWKMTRGKELPPEMFKKEEKDKNPLKTYWEILKLKPFKWIMGFGIMFYIGYIAFQSGLTYFALYCVGLSETQVSSLVLISVLLMMAMTMGISILANKIGKTYAMGASFLFTAVGFIVMGLIGVHSYGMFLVLFVIFQVANGAFWLLLYPITYDVSEVYDYKYGKRREASILSIMALIASLAAALGTQILAVALHFAGFDAAAAVQSASTVKGISMIVLGIPVVACIIASVFCFLNPMTKHKYEKLVEQLERKKAGEEPDETGLERLI